MGRELLAVDIQKLFAEELALCRTRPDEKVVVLSEPGSRDEYAAAAFGAAHAIGADVMHLQVPGGSTVPFPVVKTGSGYGLQHLHDLALRALRGADLVVDVTLEGYIHTPTLKKILEADTRVLLVCEPVDVLERNLTSAADKSRGQYAAGLLTQASTMRVTSTAGTDLEVDLTDSHPGYQCGFTDDPGRWDHWPSSMVLCWPKSEGVHGRIVLQEGDIIFPFKDFVDSRITIDFEKGRIQGIDGGADARRLQRFLEEGDDPQGWLTSHMGWGLLRSATWSSMGMYSKETIMGMEGRCVYGNFMISTGPNPYDNRWTPVHTDIPMQGCTIELDGQPVVEHGAVLRDQ